MEACGCRKDWLSGTRCPPPHPLLLPWGAPEEAAGADEPRVLRVGASSSCTCSGVPFLTAPPPRRVSPLGFCPELAVEWRTWIISTKNIHFRGGETQLWGRKGRHPSPVRRSCLCGTLGMGISGQLLQPPGHLQHLRVQVGCRYAGVRCVGVCRCVCMCDGRVCVKEAVLVSSRTVPSVYLGMELAWGKLWPLGCLTDLRCTVRPLLSRHPGPRAREHA